jgi:hypothetical protein
MSACKAGMRPVGLAIKTNHKKYASGRSGELMLVHLCLDCGKLSATRIAADDDVETILKVYTSSTSQQKCHHSQAGMAFLNGYDSELVYQRLFGYGTALERNSIRNGPEMDYGYAPDRSICLVDS